MGSDTSEGAVSLGIASGEFSRTILEALRDASEPLGVRGIADALIARAGKTLDRRETNLVVAPGCGTAMPRLSDRLEGELWERTTFWSVKAT